MSTGFVAAAMINRSLGPSTRGVYAEMQTWIELFAVLFGMSLVTAIYHFANKSLYGNDDQSRFITTFSMSLIYGFLASTALTIFVYAWPEKVSTQTYEYLILLNALIIATMLVGNLVIFLQAIGDIRYSAVIGVVQGVMNTLIIGYAYWSNRLNIRMVLISVLMMQSIGLIMLLVKFRKYNYFAGRFSKSLAKGIFTAGLKQHIATIATFVYTKINQLIVFKYCGESSAGLFAVSLSAALYLTFIPMTFQTVLYPRVIHASDDYEITIRSLRWGFYAWGVIVFLLILFAKPILLLYGGNSFLPSVSNFRILMIATWFLPLSSMLAPYYIKVGAFGLASVTAVFLGAVSIGLNIVLVPRYADVGASVATALTCFIGFCIILAILWYLSRKNPFVIFHPNLKQEIVSFRMSFLSTGHEEDRVF